MWYALYLPLSVPPLPFFLLSLPTHPDSGITQSQIFSVVKMISSKVKCERFPQAVSLALLTPAFRLEVCRALLITGKRARKKTPKEQEEDGVIAVLLRTLPPQRKNKERKL